MAPPAETEMLVLAPRAGGREWDLTSKAFSVDALAALPKQCYIFLDVANDPPPDVRRLLAYFNVPQFVGERTCFELNGYFGNKVTYARRETSGEYVASYYAATWFRSLVKMVKKVEQDPHEQGPEYADEKGYKWFEMTFFTRWDHPNSSQVLCVHVPSDFQFELKRHLEKRTEPLDFRDPYAMHVNLVDLVIFYTDVAVWRVRDPVRVLEKNRMGTSSIFGPIHEMSRHAIHTSEVLEATIDTLREMQQCQIAIQGKLAEDLGETYREQAKDHAQFQISMAKNLKLRSDSNHKRLENEINLAFNNIARQDNDVMKSIALLTMIFLPPTFISAIFSTTFFGLSDQDKTWMVSDKLWIYWATTVPATIITVALWRVWLANGDAIAKFSHAQIDRASARWKALVERRVLRQRASEKVDIP
ncbi:hypothetical protein C7999DRAFT_42807 [Corynascus novoguineensis]|uniref:Uncharacterized protein n=1 Tax=Corynascus novoguineensis TaxID=1126955 RepID=A0AAN7HHG6_9PEZI|nr:hypothetical protein C7999DRAFT_42807 [Corynascus novoguineensis]